MKWKRESLQTVKKFVVRMNSDQDFYKENIESLRYPAPDGEYAVIRKRLKDRYDSCSLKKKNKEYEARSQEFGMDLEMAAEIQSIGHDYGMTLRDAADEEIWLYFNIHVIPDIILDRWKDKHCLNSDRFYENSRRNYLSMLWWFLHICWQETGMGFSKDLEATLSMVSMCQADDFSDLIERAGTGGYPIEVYKEIMVQYCKLCHESKPPSEFLNHVLQRNIVQMQQTEPELVSDGLSFYVSELFKKVIKNG